MDRDKLRRKVEQQTARDHTNMRHWSDRKLRKYEKTMNEPILPSFCTITFVCMIVSTFVTSAGDIYNYCMYHQDSGLWAMLRNASVSAFFSWILFAAMLIPCATIQLRRGFDDPYFKKMLYTRRGKPRMPVKKRFRIYQVTACVGVILFSALLIFTSIFS